MFWKNFYELCMVNNLKPLQVVNQLHIAAGSITSWKNGTTPSAKNLKKLADFFKVSVEYFFIDHSEGNSETKKEPEYNQHIFISYASEGSNKANELGLNLTADQTEKLKEILERFNKLPEDKQDDYLDMFEKMLKMNESE